MQTDNKIKELVYAGKGVEDIIKKNYPQAKITDASDFITERFELEITGIGQDDFYPIAIKEGFAMACLGFSIMLNSLGYPNIKGMPRAETKAKIQKWIELAKQEAKDVSDGR